MKTKISEADFAVLAAQTGLRLTDAQRREIHAAYGTIEAMLARIGSERPREAEPALIFRAETE
ncbi:hypothetical protein [Limobrevibacterium gyesilva]|uniref:Uncharacterized protein n=1 Tax=Limobrevibacterium gyesilva TaxID=2991712 RepID=A0AA42CCE6_9PROT|nr:hypothetical protein [Limobrevibacterium gyesilva]MCW3473223.1 hypothetical protein [Limobrevibacterium gyesilva]